MNEKLKFAIRAALSLMLAYLIPLAMGWPMASNAATCVMLIASTGSQKESISKGLLRIIGTIVGAIFGLTLVGLFAQDRLLYMLVVSICVSFVFYFRNAYKQDPTLFALTGMMVLMMSNGGDADGAFMYGVERTFMTAFGVVVYMLVGLFVFPNKTKQNLRQLTKELTNIQQQMFRHIIHQYSQPPVDAQSTALKKEPPKENDDSENNNEEKSNSAQLIKQLYAAQNALENQYPLIKAEYYQVSLYQKEWELIIHHYKQVTQLLIFAVESADSIDLEMDQFISHYSETVACIEGSYNHIHHIWQQEETGKEIKKIECQAQTESLNACSHLEKGAVITCTHMFNVLMEKLSYITEIAPTIDSLKPRIDLKASPTKKIGNFLWWDAENAKTAIKVFITYWIAGLIWIYFNPPGGYSFVVFSTVFMSLLSYLPIHPILLFILFTFSFLFSAISYVFILPQLTLGIELGIFIFTYAFIAFYLFKGPITIFFLFGLFILGIDNTMSYHFNVILSIMLMFYLVVSMIMLSHYFPFSSRPEHLFLTIRARFFRHVTAIFYLLELPQLNRWQRLKLRWHLTTMNVSIKKLPVWRSKVNMRYFDQNSPEILGSYISSAQLINNHLNTMIASMSRFTHNPLITKVYEHIQKNMFTQIAHSLTQIENKNEAKTCLNIEFNVEQHLSEQLTENDFIHFSQQEIANFYIFLHLKRNIFKTLKQCAQLHQEIHWLDLKKKRF